MLSSWLTVIKKSIFWKPIVLFLSFWVDLVWRLTYGLQASLLYMFCVRRVKDTKLRRDGLKIVRSSPYFIEFSEWLSENISKDLILSETEKMKSEDTPTNFTTDLLPLLNTDTQVKIVKFALEDKNIEAICGYLKFVPRLESIQVMLNIPSSSDAIGSQRWHRDWFNYKGMNIFTALTDVGEETGIYSAVGLRSIPRRAEIPVYQNDQSVHAYDRDRVSDASMLEFTNKEAIEYLQGPPGTTAFVDSGWVYHKGGHLKNGYRLMIQIAYRAEQKPKAANPTNILEELGLIGNDNMESILDSSVRRYMVGAGLNKSRFGWVFHRLSRYLTYYKEKTF
jgi:hypothetical protein